MTQFNVLYYASSPLNSYIMVYYIKWYIEEIRFICNIVFYILIVYVATKTRIISPKYNDVLFRDFLISKN